MVLIPSNSNEDSQGTQLRVSKKLATVCSGKRLRFSKPRPNLAIAKRGETDGSASKTSKTSVEQDRKVEGNDKLSCDEDPNKKSVEQDSEVKRNNELPHEDANKISVEQDSKIEKNHVLSNENANEKIVEEAIKVVSVEDVNDEIVEEAIKAVSFKDANVINSENIDVDISSAEKLSVVEDAQVILNADATISISKKSIQTTTSTNDNNSSEENDAQTSPLKNSGNSSKENDVQTSPLKNSGNSSRENDVQTSPLKNSGSPLKTPEAEKRGVLSTTPTVIDKSKYPHLTSILSKKRSEPRKEVQQKRRRKFKKGDAPPERSKMTMADLIYWNPVKIEEPSKNTATVDEIPIINDFVEEESVDGAVESENIIDSVPKLVISEDGQINIDQSSLFVSRNIPQPISTEVVKKDDTTYSSFRKRPLTKHWTAKDTANFYKALGLVGADFSLMEQIFPNRSRRELKHKFKREEKHNIDIINKVLYETQTYDEQTLDAFIYQISTVDDPSLINEKEEDATGKIRKPRAYKKAKHIENEAHDSSIDNSAEETENAKQENKRGRKKKAIKISGDEDAGNLITSDCITENGKHENKRGRKKKAKKMSDDEDVGNLIATDCINTGELKSSKRKRNAKKLPDDFVSIDSIEALDILDELVTNDLDNFVKASSSEMIQENSNSSEIENVVEEVSDADSENVVEEVNDAEENPSESACTIFNKIMNVENQQNIKKEASSAAVPLAVATNADDEYVSVEYIENDDTDTDLCMLRDVVAFEVVNTQVPAPKRRRKSDFISPTKNRDYLTATKISPTNYTAFTPV